MSKMDNLRAMREARYDRATARSRQAAAPTEAARPPTALPRAVPDVVDASVPADDLCGHRNMSGRTCTRERGHAAKSHRYS